MVSALRFRIGNDAVQLNSLRASVRGHLEAHDVDGKAVYGVDLALEELAGNVLRYGYASGIAGELNIAVVTSPTSVAVTIEDNGRPFDPTCHPEPSRARSISESSIGGRGISMVRRSARSMTYCRESGVNRTVVEIARAVDS